MNGNENINENEKNDNKMKVLSTILFAIFAGLIVALILLQPKKEKEEELEAKIVVVDSETDEPIKGVKLKITTTDEDCPEMTLTTDENGECTFTYSDSEAKISVLKATKSGYERVEMTDYELSNFEDDDLTITMKPQDLSDRGRQIGANGALKITLMWDDPNADLDLHVIEPNGYEISYLDGREGHMVDPDTGGELDVDWQPALNQGEDIGENAVWSNPPRGTYKPWVQCYGPEDIGSVECTVIIYQENQPDQKYTLTINGQNDKQEVPDVIVE